MLFVWEKVPKKRGWILNLANEWNDPEHLSIYKLMIYLTVTHFFYLKHHTISKQNANYYRMLDAIWSLQVFIKHKKQ